VAVAVAMASRSQRVCGSPVVTLPVPVPVPDDATSRTAGPPALTRPAPGVLVTARRPDRAYLPGRGRRPTANTQVDGGRHTGARVG
jgi:hypothetical protein